MTHRFVPCVSVLLVLSFMGCSDKGTAPPRVVPTISAFSVRPNAHNVLSAVGHVTLSDAATVQMEIRDERGNLELTPAMQVRTSVATIPVLGLRERTAYAFRVVARSDDLAETWSEPVAFVTDSLPGNLPNLSVTVRPGVSEGFVMLVGPSTNNPQRFYAYIINNSGRVVWYRAFVNSVVDFQKQPDGTYTVFASLTAPPGNFFRMDNLGNVLNEFRSLTAPETGPHELRLRNDGYILFGIEHRMLDLSRLGGQSAASVRGLTVEYNRFSGNNFVWNTFDYFNVEDALPDIPLTGSTVNPWHGNAIDVDTDGNLLVSWRSLGEITKINITTGAMMWRWGGRNNQFTFLNDPLNGFSHQHAVRRLPNGNVILFDNGNLHTPPTSRAVEYVLNESSRTARLVWEFRPHPPISSPILGFAQRLSNGNTVVCFGRAQRIFEVTAVGDIVWEVRIETPGNYPYRALRIDSLY